MGFHLEHHRLAIADVDDAGIFARSLDDARPLGGQGAQPFLGALVGAMLVPHRREDAQLGIGRLAPDQVEDLLVLVRLEAVIGDQFGSDGDVVAKGHQWVRYGIVGGGD
ncbi:hypothetical protein D3C87_1701660 [compost metagenome]